MRTLSKDIMMICKGWGASYYGHHIVPALKYYLSQYTGLAYADINSGTLAHFLGNAVVKACSIEELVESLNNSISGLSYANKPLDETIIKLYISLLALGELSEADRSIYKDIFKYCEEGPDNQQPWWEHFGIADVEDDRR